MKKVQIDYELFRKLIFYHLGSDDQYEEDIRNVLEGTFDGRQAVESAFALLLTKVTKHDRHIWRFKMNERRFIEKDNQFYDRERLPEP